MTLQFTVLRRTGLVSTIFLATTLAGAQAARMKMINIVLPTGPGKITVPLNDNLQWNNLALFDKPARFSFEVNDTTTKVEAVFSLSAFTGSAKSCRDGMLSNATTRGQASSKAD